MKVNGLFTDNNTFDFFDHKIIVEKGCFLTLEILKAPFEHITVNFINPEGVCLFVTTLKTRLQNFKLYENITPGEWTIKIIRSYPVPPKYTKDYSLEINQVSIEKLSEYNDFYSVRSAATDVNKFTNSTQKYYSGDIHLHTNFSDGRMAEQDLLDISRLRGLEFLAPTDHNVWTPFKTLMPLIPAYEYTPDDFGHFNVYGILEDIPAISLYENSNNLTEALQNLLEYREKNDLLISINHPFCSMCPSARDFNLKDVQLLEVINSPNSETEIIKNNYALQAFDLLWSYGYKIFGVGGSDAHRTIVKGMVRPGNPTIHVFADNNAPTSLLQGIKQGHTYLTSNVDLSLKIVHQNKEILPGTEVSGNVQWHVSSDISLHWNLIKNGSIISSKEGVEFIVETSLEKGDFVRLEGRTKQNEIKVFMNPIYNSLQKEKELTWFDVLDQIGTNPRAI